MFTRRAVVLMPVAAVMTGPSLPSAWGQETGTGTAIRIFADADWYRLRSEPEQRWRGTLREREQDAGPGARLGLTLGLETAREVLPIYAAGVEDRLRMLLGRPVEVSGKLVNLASEGFGPEIWIATVRPLPPAR